MATYYVSVTGNDSGTGSATSPFRTIDRALNLSLGAGDTVLVKPGTYNEAINVDRSGSAAGDFTLKSEVPGAALIRPPASQWNAVSVNANYVTVEGFDIAGSNGDGIETNNRHHVKILNNIVHDSGESGIQFNQSEFITVEGNVTYNNASDGWFSGISIYQSRNITGDSTTSGFRTIVRNNVSYDNVTKGGEHTDGNGIIIDDFQSTQTGGHPNYTYATLVENNLVYNNGGKGIQVTWSDNVTVRNNTSYHNNLDSANPGTWRGELSNQMSDNNTWVNNIAVADSRVDSDNTAIGDYSSGSANSNIVWRNNLTFNGTAGQSSFKLDGGNAGPTAANGNLLGVDPHFVNAGVDFNLLPGSLAMNAGSSAYGLAASDLDGGARVVGVVDLGAYEAASGGGTAGSVNARADRATTDEDHSIVIDVLSNDAVNGSGSLSIQALNLSGTRGTAWINAGEVAYDPGNAYRSLGSGQVRMDRLSYTVTDGNGHTDTATVRVRVQGVNEAPQALRDSGISGTVGTETRIQGDALLSNDRDGDSDGLVLTSVGGALNGTVRLNDHGRVTFIGDDDGPASFYYTVKDRNGGTDTTRVSLDIRNGQPSSVEATDTISDGADGSAVGTVIRGTDGNDLLLGGAGNDALFGGDGNDFLRGGAGDDRLFGGSGSILVGGKGDDAFIIAADGGVFEIRHGDGAAAFEGIGGSGGDVIDLRAVDADTATPGHQALTLDDLTLSERAGATIIQGNTDGDTDADFTFKIFDGDTSAARYHAADFVF